MTSNMFYLLHLYYKTKEFTQYSEKKEFPNKKKKEKKNLVFKGI